MNATRLVSILRSGRPQATLMLALSLTFYFLLSPPQAEAVSLYKGVSTTLTPDHPMYSYGQIAQPTLEIRHSLIPQTKLQRKVKRYEVVVHFPDAIHVLQSHRLRDLVTVITTPPLESESLVRVELFKYGTQHKLERRERYRARYLEQIENLQAQLDAATDPSQREQIWAQIMRRQRTLDRLEAKIAQLEVPLATAEATLPLEADVTPPVTTANPAGGTYGSPVDVVLTANEPATIYYTTDGSTPTTGSSVYTAPIPISTDTTLKFFGVDADRNEEAIKTEVYVIDQTPPTTTATPSGGTYADPIVVTLTADEPATIYYTLDGSTPTTGSPTYTAPIPISTDTTLKFFAEDAVGNQETVQTEVYEFMTGPTYVGGNITTDTTWTLRAGPYIATSTVTVINSATLTIEAGVEVRFNASTGLNIGYSGYSGILIAQGTPTEPITIHLK